MQVFNNFIRRVYLSEMKARLSSHELTALFGLATVPSIMVGLPSEEYFSKLIELADIYEADLLSPGSVTSELHCWQMKWMHHQEENGERSLPSSPSATLGHVASMYPNTRDC